MTSNYLWQDTLDIEWATELKISMAKTIEIALFKAHLLRRWLLESLIKNEGDFKNKNNNVTFY